MSEEPASESSEIGDFCLLAGLREGDAASAAVIFERYLARLSALARSRMSAQLAVRIDPDDVVMSAYRSFFLRARGGEFSIEQGSELWRLLVEITLHKLYRQSTHHAAQRRSFRRESADDAGTPAIAASREPSPEVAAMLADELAAAMDELSPDVRLALELRLQGLELTEIAESLGKSERTVRRWLDEAKAALRRRFPEAVPLTSIQPPRQTRLPKPLPLESWLPKSLLNFDEYTLTRQIGAGSSGKVYRAVVKPSGTVVAVKFMKRALLRRREVVQRFLQEAQLVSALNHPGVIRIHGVGRTPNRGYFLAMDLCEQGDLQRRIQVGPIAVGDALRWVAEAADAIQHARDHGIIHCDLKPSNLLLADDGHIVVTDFGLARTSADSSSGDIAGTPAFLAPEQLNVRWGTIGPRTDVYGLGAILYTLLAGRPPRTGSIREVLDVVADGGEPVSILGLPPSIAGLIQACLSAKPAERPTSAMQISVQLQSLAINLASST